MEYKRECEAGWQEIQEARRQVVKTLLDERKKVNLIHNPF